MKIRLDYVPKLNFGILRPDRINSVPKDLTKIIAGTIKPITLSLLLASSISWAEMDFPKIFGLEGKTPSMCSLNRFEHELIKGIDSNGLPVLKKSRSRRNKSLDDELLIARNLFLEGKISDVEKLTLQRVVPYIDTIERMEYLLGPLSYDFKYKVGAESDFNPNAISGVGAIGLSQLMPIKIADINQKMRLDERIVKNYFDIDKVDSMHITEDLSKIDEEIKLDELGFDYEKAKNYKLNISRLKNVVLPRYLLLKRIFPTLSLDEAKVSTDPQYNLKTGYAVHISNKLELGTLQMIKSGNSIVYMHRPFNYFDGENKNLRAFTNEEIDAGYNCGIYGLKKFALKKAYSGVYCVMPFMPEETKLHSKRIKEYKERFENLQENGLLDFQLDELA